jgi:hypothetical protein
MQPQVLEDSIGEYLNICSFVCYIEGKNWIPAKIMTTVTEMKCACEPCLCVVSTDKAVEKDGKYYCSDACANAHPDGQGCGHKGCGC